MESVSLLLQAQGTKEMICWRAFILLTGSFLGCWCNLPWVFKCLFLVSIKQEERCKHNGGFSQYVMKNWCNDEMQLLFTILVTFFFLRFLNFYLCCRVENMVLYTGPSHSQDINMMTISSFHWPSRLHISWQASSLMSLRNSVRVFISFGFVSSQLLARDCDFKLGFAAKNWFVYIFVCSANNCHFS